MVLTFLEKQEVKWYCVGIEKILSITRSNEVTSIFGHKNDSLTY